MSLTELKSLAGCAGSSKIVMGCISKADEGRYILEDESASVPVDLSGAETTAGFFTGALLATDFQSILVSFPMAACYVSCVGLET